MRVLGFALLIGAALFGDAALVEWLVFVVHGWWPLVPLMSYGQALGVSFVVLVSAFCAVLVYLLGTLLLD